MKSITKNVLLLILVVLSFSCKNDTASDGPAVAADNSEVVKSEEKKVITEEEKKVIKSVMSKIMILPSLKSFSRVLVTGGFTDMLGIEEGPYTIFAPSNEAFESLTEVQSKRLLNPSNLAQLKKIIEDHMVLGNYLSADLIKNETSEITALGGSQLVVFLKGNDLWVKDADGKEAKIIQTDVMGNNGVVHVLDQLLHFN